MKFQRPILCLFLACCGPATLLRADESTERTPRPPRDERSVIIGDRSAPAVAPPANEIDLRRAFAEVTPDFFRSVVVITIKGEQAALGVVVSADGYIISKSSELTEPLNARLASGRSLPARIIGRADEHDVALLKIDATNLTAIPFKDGDDAAVGKWIASVGTSEVPLAVGVVSVGRRVIPADAIMGVFLEDSDVEGGDIPGARITNLDPQGGAARGGVRAGDIVIKIDDRAIIERQDVLTALSRLRPGDKVSVVVARGEERITLDVKLAQRPSPSTRSLRQNTMGGKLSARRTGFAVVFQHDTVNLQPTDCGSPLVTLDGEVVGLNVSRAGRTETYAVPSSVVLKLIEELKQSEHAPDATVSSDDKPDP